MKLIYNFGTNSDYKYKATTKQYITWSDMVRRCYDLSVVDNPRYKNYVNCSVVDEWRYCTMFGDWASDQIGFGLKDYCLDKDILVPDNKVYSPETCCFVPREINMSLTLRDADRGDYPLGICGTVKNKFGEVTSYVVRVRRGELPRLQKGFETIEEAQEFYKLAKADHLKYLANKYKEVIDGRVYVSLSTYEF